MHIIVNSLIFISSGHVTRHSIPPILANIRRRNIYVFKAVYYLIDLWNRLLEQGINKIFTDYAKSSKSQWVVNLAEYRVERLRNPKIENIKELVKLFDPTFEKELNRAWINDQDNEKKYIHELVNKRISLAHGKGNHGQITTGDLKNYFKAYESLLTRLLMHFQRGHNL